MSYDHNPFSSPEAQLHANYQRLPLSNIDADPSAKHPLWAETQTVADLLHEFVLVNEHPCIMARSTMRNGNCRFGLYPALASAEATAGLAHDLLTFLNESATVDQPFVTYMAVFQEPQQLQEKDFEQALWKQLSQLARASAPFFAPDPGTSQDPDEPTFSFGFGGKAFYVVGMHANSNRKARQFAYPMLVFNLHEQFESMRSTGNYEKVKSVIRRNDLQLQGSINPMLQDFGHASEARQYSGRQVPSSWKCPYAP